MAEPRVSADPQKQRDYEVFCKGWDNGVEYEQERIIKRLEADICPNWTTTCCDGACRAYKDAIALIQAKQQCKCEVIDSINVGYVPSPECFGCEESDDK